MGHSTTETCHGRQGARHGVESVLCFRVPRSGTRTIFLREIGCPNPSGSVVEKSQGLTYSGVRGGTGS